MFFSLDPNVFRNPKSTCLLSNGTKVYSNHSIAGDCSCVAPFAAAPDLGGPGIIASFCFMAWLTILVAAVPAFYSVRRSWRWSRTNPPNRVWKFVCDVLQLRITRETPREDPTAPNAMHARVQSTGTMTSDASEQEPKVLEAPREEYPDVEPYTLALAKALLVPLTDVQIVIGLAYIITGLGLMHRISFYHEQFVTNLWWLTLNSLWVSRIDYNENTTQMMQWRFQVRRLAILASVILSTVFQALVAFREHNSWDATQPGRCYVGAALGSNLGDNLFWLIGTGLYAVVLIFGSWSYSRIWFDEQILERVDPSMVFMWDWANGSVNEFQAARTSTNKSGTSFVGRMIRLLFLAGKTALSSFAFLMWWVFIQFLAIWSSGVGSPVVEMIVYIGFAVESTVWVIFLKVSNKVLTMPPGVEDKWTFGQMLPIALLVLVLFYTFDAEKGE
jgi:hypothetical protein